MQQWEYCWIRHFYDAKKIFVNGAEVPIDKGEKMEQMVLKLLDDLGKQGWEMIGSVAPHEGLYYLYFKRPLTQDHA